MKTIARIYSKVAESNSQDNRDVVAEFIPEDFQVDIAFCDKVQYDGGDKKAVRCAFGKLVLRL